MRRMLTGFCALALLAGTVAQAALTSAIKMHDDKPTLYVNGQITSPIFAAPYKAGPGDFKDFEKGGISIFDIYVKFPWTGPETWDFSEPDQKLDEYLNIDPHAMFMPRILLTPGEWFAQQYPGEISMRDDGTPAGMFGRGTHPSFASEHYRELSHRLMTVFINHLEEKYGDHIVGYQVGNGFGGEWLPFNSFWETHGNQPHPTKFGVEDYSPASKAAFREWLKAKYKEDAPLQKAWGDDKLTIANAEPPSEKDRYSPTHGIFFDPAVSSRVPDFMQYYNESVAKVLMENAHWIKELTHGQKIVGSFYGYLWCNFPNLSANRAGQLGLSEVLRSPDVDFLASPYTYDNKYVGGPDNSQSLPEAAAIHGKFYFNEVDTETWLTQRQWRWGDSVINPKNWEETKGLLVRDYAYAFTKGFGMWWTDLFGGTFHDDKILNLFAELKKIDVQNLDGDKSSNAEIAVVLDDASFTYCGDGEPLFNALLTAQKQWQLGYLGASWEPMLLTDMGNPKMKDYKFYIFLNTIRVTPVERVAIQARLKRNGATALWVYAPGYIDKACSVDNLNALTGIKLAEDDTAGELHVDVTNLNDPLTKALSKPLAYGTDVDVAKITATYDHRIYLKDPRDPGLNRDLPGFRISPRFYSVDPQATVLGTLAGLNKPGLVVKKQDGWTSIYSSAQIVPAALLRGIARAAGCHVYSDANDVVYANKHFLAIYAPSGGTRTVHLPEKAKVVDLLEKKTIAENVTDFPLTIPANTSILLGLE